MLASQAIPAIAKFAKAGHQANQAKKLAKTERPKYDIPEAVKQAVASARLQAGNTQLPGQNLAEQKLGQNTSNAIAELKNVSNNPNDLATNVARLYQGQMGQQNNLNIAAAQNFNDNQGMLRDQLGMLGQYQDKEWDINKFQPYKNNMAASSALREGAYRNAMSGVTDVASGLSGYGNMQFQQTQLDKLIAAGKTPTNTGTGITGALNGLPMTPNTNNNSGINLNYLDFFNKKNRSGNPSFENQGEIIY